MALWSDVSTVKTKIVRNQSRGFTLLEVMIALTLLAMIIGMVLGIARTSLGLSKSIVEHQNAEMEQLAFMDLIGQRLSSLPGNARMELTTEDTGSHYLSDLTLQNVPMSFTWGGQERIAKAVQLSTIKRRSGFLDIVLRYYENEILENSAATVGKSGSAEKEQPFAEIVLMSDVAYFEWRVLNTTTMEWQDEWEDASSMPLQMELVMAVGVKGDEIRHVFWLPPKLNPEQVMRQMGASSTTPANPAHPDPNHPGVEIHLPPQGGGP
jgi:prepilin-type N-terminal cleavage/methylation domain-containing protein